ncbi:hypothetical protein PORY_002854 [Pneumocystis oryctolagi]|uniref:Uncharacterized protein n=1 Tax=Pneumocystis oryctolagi TaxID=42067 RepID=A0ACB7C8E1_9ASCO|nr:hypothetical protein PORY_002854 [Pneumocystis oryctolagi]
MKCNKSCSFLFFYIKPFIESPLKKNLCHYSTKSVLSGYNKKVVNTTFKFFSYISWKKGYASSIYFSKKNSLKYEEKSKYPDLLKTVAEPKSEKSDSKVNNWKREMAKLRRQYLTEYVMEQKKNDELKKKEIKEKPLVFKTETSNLSSDENFDECIPTIQSSFKNEYQLLDINKKKNIKIDYATSLLCTRVQRNLLLLWKN